MESHKDQGWSPPQDWPIERRLIWDLGFFGHYLHKHEGGRSGKKRILSLLAKHGGALDQRELQDQFDIKSGSLSEVLSKLEAEKLISRSKSAEDARRLVVSLTPAGAEQAMAHRREADKFEKNALSCLSPDEQFELLLTLDHLIAHWNNMERTDRKGE